MVGYRVCSNLYNIDLYEKGRLIDATKRCGSRRKEVRKGCASG